MEFHNAMFGSDSDSEGDNGAIAQEGPRLAEVRTCPDFGGGRGLFATQDIPRGSLVLSEKPFVTVTARNGSLKDLTALLRLVDGILGLGTEDGTGAEREKDVMIAARGVCAQLFPQRLEDADGDEVAFMAVQLGLDAEKESDKERLRVALTLQHNMFASGLYLQTAMLNHRCCAPNCLKVPPSGATAFAGELWTTRDVKKDEQLFISYMEPLEELAPSILADFLWSHHRFRCRPAQCALHARAAAQGAGGEGDRERDRDRDDVTAVVSEVETFVDECTPLLELLDMGAGVPESSTTTASISEAIGEAERLLEVVTALKLAQGPDNKDSRHTTCSRLCTRLHRLSRDLIGIILSRPAGASGFETETGTGTGTGESPDPVDKKRLAKHFIDHSHAWLAGVDACYGYGHKYGYGRDGHAKGGGNERAAISGNGNDESDGTSQAQALDPLIVGPLEALAECCEISGVCPHLVKPARSRASHLRKTFSMRVRYPQAARALMNAEPGYCWWATASSLLQ